MDGETVIATNAHVVEHSLSIRIAAPVVFGQETFETRVLAICHSKDVALLQLKPGQDLRTAIPAAEKATDEMLRETAGQETPGEENFSFSTLELGDSDVFVQGSKAVAVGYPLGQNNLKLSSGIVAGLEHVDDRLYLQMTSPISPGNSGGPLLSSSGRVMGINTAAIEGASNVAYAIPTNHIRELFRYFIASTRPQPTLPRSLLAIRGTSGGDPLRVDRAEEMEETLEAPTEERSESMASPDVVKHFPIMGVMLDGASELLPRLLGYESFWRAAAKEGSDGGAEGVCPNLGGVLVRRVRARGLLKDAGVESGDLLLSFNGYCLDRFGETVLEPRRPEDDRSGPRVGGIPNFLQLRSGPPGTGADGMQENLPDHGARYNIFDLAERIPFGDRLEVTVWRRGKIQRLSTLFETREDHLGVVRYRDEPLLTGISYEVFGGLVFMDLTVNHIRHFTCADHIDRTEDDEPRLPCFRNPSMVQYEADETGSRLSQPRLVVADVIAGSNIPDNSISAVSRSSSAQTLIASCSLSKCLPLCNPRHHGLMYFVLSPSQGDIVVAVNGEKVSSLDDFRKHFLPTAWKKKKTRSGTELWWLQTQRGGVLVLNFRKQLLQEQKLAGVHRYGFSELLQKALDLGADSAEVGAGSAAALGD